MKPIRIAEYTILLVVIVFAGTRLFRIGFGKTCEANKQLASCVTASENPQK